MPRITPEITRVDEPQIVRWADRDRPDAAFDELDPTLAEEDFARLDRVGLHPNPVMALVIFDLGILIAGPIGGLIAAYLGHRPGPHVRCPLPAAEVPPQGTSRRPPRTLHAPFARSELGRPR